MRGAIHHVELYVSDLQHSVAFWGWLLGELGYTEYQAWQEGRSWTLGGTYIVLVQTPPDQVGAGYHRRRTGLNHIAFHVESHEAVRRSHRRAAPAGRHGALRGPPPLRWWRRFLRGVFLGP